MKNRTDYVFPEDWGIRDSGQKDFWYKQERVYRQAMRQETRWGKVVRKFHAESEFKQDEPLE